MQEWVQLRLVSRSFNEYFSYRGVCWDKTPNPHERTKWKAVVTNNGESHFIGVFENAEKAAMAYDIVAREQHGLKAQLNFPTTKEEQAAQITTLLCTTVMAGKVLAKAYLDYSGTATTKWARSYLETPQQNSTIHTTNHYIPSHPS